MTPTTPIPASLATACAAHDRHRLDVLDALLDEAAPSAVRELFGAALDLCATLRADLASERAHLAACQTRIAGLEQAANERSKEVARLTAERTEWIAAAVAIGEHVDHLGPVAGASGEIDPREWIHYAHSLAGRVKARIAGDGRPCNGSCDIALASRQVGPDGIVPRNARECAELWEREAARLWHDYLTVVDAIMPRSDGPAHAAATARSHRRHIDELETEVARLTARVAELEARPVLTEGALHAAVNAGHGSWNASLGIASWPGTIEIARRAFAALGAVTLPAQDRAEELAAAYCDAQREIGGKEWSGWDRVSKEVRDLIVGSLSRALASLGAPATTPTAAPGMVAAVSMDEALRDYDTAFNACKCEEDVNGCCRRSGLRAVLARLNATTIAPVDPEAVARRTINGSPTDRQIERCRDALTTAGIPVTPEVDK